MDPLLAEDFPDRLQGQPFQPRLGQGVSYVFCSDMPRQAVVERCGGWWAEHGFTGGNAREWMGGLRGNSDARLRPPLLEGFTRSRGASLELVELEVTVAVPQVPVL